jgi:hypothetical protein
VAVDPLLGHPEEVGESGFDCIEQGPRRETHGFGRSTQQSTSSWTILYPSLRAFTKEGSKKQSTYYFSLMYIPRMVGMPSDEALTNVDTGKITLPGLFKS